MNDKMLGLVQQVVRYLLESEADDFSTWLIGGNGGPKEGVGTVAWIDKVLEYMEDKDNEELWDWLAQNTDGHIYVDAYILNKELNLDSGAFRALARELIDDVEAVQTTEDVRETWPDLWATYERACSLLGVEPNPSPDGGSVSV